MTNENDNAVPSHTQWAQGRATLTVNEIADACGVSAKTIRRWIELEGLPTVRLPAAGARPITLIIPSDLDAWLAESRHQSSATEDEPTVKIDGFRFLDQKSLDNQSTPRSSVTRMKRKETE
tara:strand:+ start:15750 stop:16112 length:363 start_codon:yes stop_codon:yes gene_type:complete